MVSLSATGIVNTTHPPLAYVVRLSAIGLASATSTATGTCGKSKRNRMPNVAKEPIVNVNTAEGILLRERQLG